MLIQILDVVFWVGVIEKITNQKYDQYIISALLAPSGVSDMQIAGNTLEERAENEVKYYS